MTRLIIIFFSCLAGAGLVLSTPVKLAPDVPSPPYPRILKSPKNIAFQLNTLLEEGKLDEFYQSASRELAKIDDEGEQDQDMERIQSRLWVFYYVAAAPFFQMEEKPDEMISWSHSRLLDYLTKISAVRYMAYFRNDAINGDTVIPTTLRAEYCALIIKDMRLSYDPESEKKQQKKGEEFMADSRNLMNKKKLDFLQLQRRERLFQYKLSTASKRNDMVKNNIQLLEEDFIAMLLRSFPGNAAKIKKYLKQAGYLNKEIPPLLDRTAGRTPKTAFLYK